MATFVYAPAIRVHVATENNGILDLSDDITQWEITRRSNAPSSFTFKLQNAQRKYDKVFRPSDRITVELKRIVWVRVFTGSLNNVPLFSAWPREFVMSATCTLKKLQFWPWDPTTTESFTMVSNFIQSINKNTNNTVTGDSGLYKLITESLVRVTGWDPKAIHIGAVPNDWFKWAQDTELAVDAATNMAAVLGPATINGTTLYSRLKLKAGHYGTANLSQTQVDNAVAIYAAAVGQTGIASTELQDRAATIALMVALAESSLLPPDTAVDHDSLGLFQQLASWGTAAQRKDPNWATLAFLKGATATGDDGSTRGGHIMGLFDHHTWTTGTNLPMICQSVQNSKFTDGSNYAQMQSTAEALVGTLRKSLTSISTSSGGTTSSILQGGGGPVPTGREGARGTGDQVAQVALRLVNVLNEPPRIQYSQSQASDPRTDNPTYLDCSQLVRWVLYHVTGTEWGPRDTHSQYPALAVKNIPMQYAKYIRGCLLYGSGSGDGVFPANGDPDHTGIAVGDGQTHVAAHQDGVPLAQQINQSDLPGGLYYGALAPDIDYARSATTEEARAHLEQILGTKCYLDRSKLTDVVDPSVTGSAPGSDAATDPFAQLVSAVTLDANVAAGDIFGGRRQLINNQPFLPWLGNLTNSTIRAYCSAPNGDFMAWFPDYFNVWDTAAVMDIKLIELQDFTVEWSDQQMVTHEFVVGSIAPGFANASGTILDTGTYDKALLSTEGLATMDFPQIFQTIYGKAASSAFVQQYLRRFGARPNVEAMPNISHGPQEFYMALWLFMKHWAEQFNASIPMTFMPELWPGMIVQIRQYGFQAYVTEVVHRGSYGPQGGFTTEAKIIAPAPIDKNLRGSLFGVLDVFGSAKKKSSAQGTPRVQGPPGRTDGGAGSRI